jgi:hypothetical protein
MSNRELPPIHHTGSTTDVSSGLFSKGLIEKKNDRESSSDFNEVFDDYRAVAESAEAPQKKRLTLADLRRSLSQSDNDGDLAEEFDPSTIAGARQAPRKTGANLAAAALTATPHSMRK